MNGTDPAFPIVSDHGINFYGIDMRDYFAAQVINTLIGINSAGRIDMQVAAVRAYRIADVMLKVREESKCE